MRPEKAFKKVRAILRLVQPELNDTYREESALLHDVGRSLSALRDSQSGIPRLWFTHAAIPGELVQCQHLFALWHRISPRSR